MQFINAITVVLLYAGAFFNFLSGKMELGFIMLVAGKVIAIGVDVSSIQETIALLSLEAIKDESTDEQTSDN